jgi:DNA polymerase-3 subunit delta'
VVGHDDEVAAVAQNDVWSQVVGQDQVVAQLEAAAVNPVHAYLFVGPQGAGKRAAARAFAALLLSAGATTPEEADRHRRLALAEQHPDLHVIEPTTATGRLTADTARGIVKASVRSPVEGDRKVLVLCDFHQVEEFGAILLKYVEEPPPSTFFIILADELVPDLVTIASRSVHIDFGPVPQAAVVAALVADGVAEDDARLAATAAGGDITRARLLATDERFALRRQTIASMPSRLDGTGARASELAGELMAMLDDSGAAIAAAHATEIDALQERIERYGQKGSGKKELEERHKREVRRHRNAELRMALATLAGAYRDAIVDHPRPMDLYDGLDRIDAAAEALIRFPNESMLLQALFARLPSLPAATAR